MLPGDNSEIVVSLVINEGKVSSYILAVRLAPTESLCPPPFPKSSLQWDHLYRRPPGSLCRVSRPCTLPYNSTFLSPPPNTSFQVRVGAGMREGHTQFQEALPLRCLTLVQALLHFACTQATLHSPAISQPNYPLCLTTSMPFPTLFTQSSVLSQSFSAYGETYSSF